MHEQHAYVPAWLPSLWEGQWALCSPRLSPPIAPCSCVEDSACFLACHTTERWPANGRTTVYRPKRVLSCRSSAMASRQASQSPRSEGSPQREHGSFPPMVAAGG